MKEEINPKEFVKQTLKTCKDPKRIREVLLHYYRWVNWYQAKPYQPVLGDTPLISSAKEIFNIKE
jgi:hypothetical protein